MPRATIIYLISLLSSCNPGDDVFLFGALLRVPMDICCYNTIPFASINVRKRMEMSTSTETGEKRSVVDEATARLPLDQLSCGALELYVTITCQCIPPDMGLYSLQDLAVVFCQPKNMQPVQCRRTQIL